jgi:hypothetical protein
MKRIMAAMIIALTMTGCASVPMGDAKRDTELKTFAVAPDRAGVYVYRNESMGAAIKFDVAIDGTAMGQTAANTYLYKEVAPGKHTLTSKAENTDTLEVEVLPGTVTFVWQEVKMGVLYARSKLRLVDEAQGKQGVQECKLAVAR